MKPLKVSEVNNYIRRILTDDIVLSNIEIEGEVSNFNKHFSGHMYFSLKDDKGRIKCVMFKSDGLNYDVQLEEGKKIIAKGYISLYEKNGEYQLYVREITEQGIGELYKEFELLKKKLEKQGLFDEKYKKVLPNMPKKIGLVTSSTGAAIKDIITVIKRRSPQTKILIYPSLVQGYNAPYEIIKGLKYLDTREDVDLIIFGRGGGSIEELFAFNNEELALTIFQLKTPCISAVGHERDFTIGDFVADLRAATPSAAGELAVADKAHLLESSNHKERRLLNIWDYIFTDKTKELKYLQDSLKYNSPLNKINQERQALDSLGKDINYKINDRIMRSRNQLHKLESRLQLLNPKLSIELGHGIITDKKGQLIKSIEDLSVGEGIKIIMKDGSLEAKIDKIKEGGSL